MNAKRLLGHLTAWAFTAALTWALVVKPAQAVVIEGTTPSGQFKAVGLDSTGALRVGISTGVAYHVITDTGSVVNILGSVEVKGNLAAVPVPVTGAGGAPVAVSGTFTAISVSTSGTVVSSQINASAIGFTVLAAASTRKQSIVCNIDSTGHTIWLGPSGVTTSNGIPLAAGACMSPDVPTSFVGLLSGISTAPVTGAISTLEFF